MAFPPPAKKNYNVEMKVLTINSAVCIAVLLVTPAATAGRRRHQPHAPAIAQPIPVPVVSPVIVRRATLPQDLPPIPPQVQYHQGMLTIYAQNSTLADIMREVRQQTGTAVDLPADAGAQRVVFSMGPARTREVLSALLQGISYNYILVGAREDPDRIQRVMLTTKRTGAGMSAPDTSSRGPMIQQNGIQQNGIISPPARNPDEEDDAPEGGGIVQPTQALPVEAAPPPQVPANPSGAPRSQDQMLQELIRRRKEQPAPAPPN